MKKIIIRILLLGGLLIGICIITSNWIENSGRKDISVALLCEKDSVILKKGDILIRPNWGWLPGSCLVENGQKYGHVAIVTEGASGKTIDEALERASVIEALFFDQATRKFQFQKKDQIREGKASISFGHKFKGIRYRLRMHLNGDQTESMIKFLRNQLDGGYDILSLKKRFGSNAEKELLLRNLKNENWHCATIVWNAYYLATGLDIDSNDGFFVYPSDIIACKYFDLPDGRVRF
jgi:hypothetical protein